MAHYYTCRDCGQKYQIEEPGRYECGCGKVFDVSVNEGKFLIRTIKKQDAPVNELNRKQEPENQPESKNPETAHCPFCHGEIPVGVRKCAHCGEWLTKKPKSKNVYALLTLLFGNLGFGEMYAGNGMIGLLFFALSICFIAFPAGLLVLWIISLLLYLIRSHNMVSDDDTENYWKQYAEQKIYVPPLIKFLYNFALFSLF